MRPGRGTRVERVRSDRGKVSEDFFQKIISDCLAVGLGQGLTREEVIYQLEQILSQMPE